MRFHWKAIHSDYRLNFIESNLNHIAHLHKIWYAESLVIPFRLVSDRSKWSRMAQNTAPTEWDWSRQIESHLIRVGVWLASVTRKKKSECITHQMSHENLDRRWMNVICTYLASTNPRTLLHHVCGQSSHCPCLPCTCGSCCLGGHEGLQWSPSENIKHWTRVSRIIRTGTCLLKSDYSVKFGTQLTLEILVSVYIIIFCVQIFL